MPRGTVSCFFSSYILSFFLVCYEILHLVTINLRYVGPVVLNTEKAKEIRESNNSTSPLIHVREKRWSITAHLSVKGQMGLAREE